MSALTKLIDFLGLTAQTEELVDAMDAKDADNLQAAKSYADTVAAAAGSSAAASSIPLSQKGTPGGVAELNSQGIVPSHQLPSFVDDVIEGYRLGAHFYSDAAHTTIVTDETGQSADQLSGKIYVDLGDNQTYRWAGSDYAVISESLALGTTEATAGRGDWTYTAYQHALAKGSQFVSNLYKITTNAEGHVIAATPVTKQDIVDLGIPGSDTVYEDATTTTHGLMSATDKAKLDGVEAGAQVNPGDATQSTHGLMSAADKAKLDGIEANANNYSLPTMGASTKGGAKLGSGLSMDGEVLNIGPLTDSGSGASVQTDGCGIFGVQGEGWAEQDTTTGKNLLDYTTFVQGSINGRGEDYTITTRLRSPLVEVNPQATYAISVDGSVGSSQMQVFEVNEYNASKSWLRSISANATNYVYHPNSDAQYVKILLRVGNNSVITVNDIVWFQLELGSTATSYEPYTGGKASPSPDYPQEIRVARGRNLLDADVYYGAYKQPDGSYRATAVQLNAAHIPIGDYIGRQITFSVHADVHKTTTRLVCRARVGNTAVEGTSVVAGASGFMYVTVTPISSDDYVVVTYGSDNGQYNILSDIQLELGTTPTPYVPYGHIGLDITANGQTTTTPIPLPAKGFAGAIGDYTDTLEVDSAGGYVWRNKTGKVTVNSLTWNMGDSSRSLLYARLSTMQLGTPLLCSSYIQSNADVIESTPDLTIWNKGWAYHQDNIVIHDTACSSASDLTTRSGNADILYALATPTTESMGYIALPELPAGATVSIPELESIGVEWWVEGIPEVTEYGQAMQARLQGEIDEAEQAIADNAAAIATLGESVSQCIVVKVVSISDSLTLSAGDVSHINPWSAIAAACPTGFKPVGIVGFTVNNMQFAVSAMRCWDYSYAVTIKNTSTSSQTTSGIQADVLYVRTGVA